MSKLDALSLGLDASLIEAAKKCNCMENDPYNPSGAGPERLPSAAGKINIADEKKKQLKKENDDALLLMKPGYNKSIQ
jgi:hypothetical protein